ncbi:cupin domain-containing protein [Pseudomonas sp. CGJS7]|uniref:cupin domain-containing protein n=1 Tax=Pseudomonas sp. CGJS7 TaxID=3109348 RepID=UPI00300B1513
MTDTANALAELLIRNIHQLPLNPFQRDPLYASDRARITEGTAARKLAAVFDVVPPGKRVCPYHSHYAQEEMFIVIEGSGTLRVADQLLPIKAGDVICIPPGPQYPHQILNTSSATLKYISIGTTDDPEICVYPDSGKFMAEADLNTEAPFEFIGKAAGGINYWEGER